jgi:hypothetical protein
MSVPFTRRKDVALKKTMNLLAYGMNDEWAHAEVAAVRKYLRVIARMPQYKQVHMIVWRIAANGTYVNSKPCGSCIAYLRRVTAACRKRVNRDIGFNLATVQYSSRGGDSQSPRGFVVTTVDALAAETVHHFSHRDR